MKRISNLPYWDRINVPSLITKTQKNSKQCLWRHIWFTCAALLPLLSALSVLVAPRSAFASSYDPASLGFATLTGATSDCTNLTGTSASSYGASAGSAAFSYSNQDTVSNSGGQTATVTFNNGQPAVYNWGTGQVIACDNFNVSGDRWDGYGDPFQCVDLIKRYAFQRWQDDPRPGASNGWGGNADTLWNTHPSHLQNITNGTGTMPVVGDILIWGPTTNGQSAPNGTPDPSINPGDPGHIAIISVTNPTNHTVDTLEQNFFFNTPIAWRRFSYNPTTGAINTATYTTYGWSNGFGSSLTTVSYTDPNPEPLYGWLHDPNNGVPTFTQDQRIGASDLSGDYVVKNGPLTQGWTTEASGLGVSSIAISGTRIGYIDGSGILWVKDESVDESWHKEWTGAKTFALTDVDPNHERIGVLDNTGTLWVKEGGLDANWGYQGDGKPEYPGVTAFALYDTRIAVIDTNGNVVAKDGALNAQWATGIASGATAIGLSGSWLGYINSSETLYIKEGAFSNGWHNEYTGVTAFAMTNEDPNHTRIGILDTNGNVVVKEGGLDATNWTTEYAGAKAFALYDTRIGVIDTSGNFWAKEGALVGVTWPTTAQLANTQSIALPDDSSSV